MATRTYLGSTPSRPDKPRVHVSWLCVIAGLVAACFLLPATATAHEVRPAIVTVSASDAGTLKAEITTNLEALIAGIGPKHSDTDQSPNAASYNELRSLQPAELERRFRQYLPKWLDGIKLEAGGRRVPLNLSAILVPETGNEKLPRISEVTLVGTPPRGATSFKWSYDPAFGTSVLRTRTAEGKTAAVGWLKDGASSPDVPFQGAAPRSTAALFIDYVVLGFTHILPKGLDHILFVLGLYLLSPGWRPLLTQVTAFTVAHSITLGLGLYGMISAPSYIVEPLIAASIVYVAVENLTTSKLSFWRPLIVFAFGLLHGLGFAGVLQEIGLPPGDYALGLVAFNIGVEGGQLAVIGLAWLATGLWFAHRSWYRSRIVWPASSLIAAIGLYWTVERVFLT